MTKRIIKLLFKIFREPIWYISPVKCTEFQYYCLKKLGVQFNGKPRYLSAKIWFDGTDYSLIRMGKNITISSNIRILTHDWALDTIYQGYMGYRKSAPLGRTRSVEIGDSCFLGTGSIIMPGTKLGKCCIVGAGAVIRGTFPDGAIIIGNPGKSIDMSSKDYLNKFI